jgi:hypothetical protein
MGNNNKINYVEQFFEWYNEFKTNDNFDEEKFNIIASGLDSYWQEVCNAKQLSLNVLKNEKLQNELNNEILNYNELDQFEQVLHNLRLIKNMRILKEYAREYLTFDILNNQSIEELEKSIAEANIIVSLHEFKNGNSNLPLYKSFIKVHEQVLNFKKLTNKPTLINDCTINRNKNLFDSLFVLEFWNLPKTKNLSNDGQSKLIDLLVLNGIPYKVAMFDYIGFFKFLENEKSLTKSKIHKTISSILDCTADNIKCNMLALLDYSTIDKDRYTSHKHKEKVKIDYHLLK